MSALVRKKFAWMDDGRCVSIGGHLFISNKTVEREQAMQICDDCPVKQQCYDYGIEQKNTRGQTAVGIWGGVDFGE